MLKQQFTIGKILSWLASTGITLIAALFVAMRWYGDYKVTNKAIADTLSIVYKNSVDTKATLDDYLYFKTVTDSRLNVVEGTQGVMDRSHIRTLELLVKSKDEVTKYQSEKIKALEDALKKKT